MKFVRSLTLLPLFVVMAACGGDDGGDNGGGGGEPENCEEDTRDETFVAGMAKTGEAGYTITLVDSDSAPPAKGDNTWTMTIADPAGSPGEDLDLDIVPFMPDHGHGTPVVAEIISEGGGEYEMGPVNLFMPGYWEIEVTAVDDKGNSDPADDVDLDTVVFKFCVEA